ncbi:hypothetical protein L3V86_05825 [Thiotrichales bacterium 19S11-10]|nr:hypothetical protein [Thiotrichales bacterium 19S11-10]MCF6807922.1 hypothetical protein [Thiotrichales bacterium 19S9-11]MCF6811937.1 hypothetical protein [Thiotrichales bacterium 19S9-12]
MNSITVESRIEREYGCSIVEFFKQCIDNGMDTADIANMINCSVSNLRRIARKHQFTFFQPAQVKMFSENKSFLASKMNVDNFLSRSWLTKNEEVIH